MPRKAKSLVKKRGGIYYENFTVKGLPRFRASLETGDEETAEIIASHRRTQAILRQRGLIEDPEPESELEEITVSLALGTYWEEHGKTLPSANGISDMGEVIIGYFGKTKPLSAIGTQDLSGFVTFLKERGSVVYKDRRPLSPRTINAHLVHMRAVMNRAESLWNCRVQKIQWHDKDGRPGLFLAEPASPTRIIETADEELKILDALDQDMRDLFDFSLASGVRRENAISLEKVRVHWQRRLMEFRIKSKKPGGEVHFIPITERIAEILKRVWDQHPTHVFSFVCQKSRSWVDEEGKRHRQTKGQRYPFTPSVVMKRWNTAREATGFHDLNWHRVRATMTTRNIVETGDPQAVQALLGHKSLATTLGYQRVSEASVRAVAEAGDAQRARDLAELRRKREPELPKKNIA